MMMMSENPIPQASPLPVSSLNASDDTSLRLREAYSLGRAAWNELAVSYEQFEAQAVQANGGTPAAPTHAADFYLAVACANADQIAHEVLEARYLPALKRLIRVTITDPAAVDDVMQEVRMRLLAGPRPKIALYRGHGSLNGWLRTIAVHGARDHFRQRRLERKRHLVFSNAQRAESRDLTSDCDDRSACDHQQRECEQAWLKAIRDVDSIDFKLLHHRFALGMSIDVLSPIYAVHRATIARRVHRAAHRVRGLVRQTLSSEHGELSPRELDSMMCEWSSSAQTVALER